MRENQWVIIDLLGKGGRIRTVAIPNWVKHGIDAWQVAAKIEEGPLLRSLNKVGKVGESLSDWAIWSVVTESAKQIGIDRFGAHDLRRTCAKLCRKAGGDPGTNQIPAGSLLHPDYRTVSGIGAGHRCRGE